MTASPYVPTLLAPWVRFGQRASKPIVRLGHMLVFFVRAVAAIPIVLRHYRGEFVRLLSDIAWGNGSLVVGGGTAGVAVVLGITVGALVGIEGYNFLDLLGLGPATGIISSLVNTRELICTSQSVHRGRSSVGVFGAFEGAAELLMWDSSSWMVGEFASGYVGLRAVRRSTRPSLKRSTRSMSRLGSLRMWLRGRRRKCSPPRGTVNSSRKRCTARAGATLLRM